MDPKETSIFEDLKELQCDLARKYRKHGRKILKKWTSFTGSERASAIQKCLGGCRDMASILDPIPGTLLECPHPRVRLSLLVYPRRRARLVPKFHPKMVTRDPHFLLRYIKFRAKVPLFDQCFQGIDGCLGDRVFAESITKIRLRTIIHERNWVWFSGDEKYGREISSTSTDTDQEGGPSQKQLFHAYALTTVKAEAAFIVPEKTGTLILIRQHLTYWLLNTLVDHILRGNDTIPVYKKLPLRQQVQTSHVNLHKLSITLKPKKFSVADLISTASEQKSSLDSHLSLCYTEPAFLAYVVGTIRESNPQRLVDENGDFLKVETDKFISQAFFEAIHNAIKAATIWEYITRLLELFVTQPKDNVTKGIILQEISNICNFEYRRAQQVFRRFFQMGSGKEYFNRMSNKYDDGVAQTKCLKKPQDLAMINRQHHYMLHICSEKNDAAGVVLWIKELEDFHQRYPADRDKILETELDAFRDLAVVVSVVRTIQVSLALPQHNANGKKAKNGQVFISRFKTLAAKVEALKEKVDLGDFVCPIANLERPSQAEGALSALNDFVATNLKTRTSMHSLYQKVCDDCISLIDLGCQKLRKQGSKQPMHNLCIAPTALTSSAKKIQARDLKSKTRPPYPSVYDSTAASEPATEFETEKIPSQPFIVKKTTLKTFSTLFSQSESRGSIRWADFESAMADLSFTVEPGDGSEVKFSPPKDMGVQKSVKFDKPHGPHGSRIEGKGILLAYRSRLHRVYGWGLDSFVAR